MTPINELKLSIYESSLDSDDKEELLHIIENTTDVEILNDIADILESVELNEIFTEAASFSILPKFETMTKKYPELKKHRDLIKEAEEVLADNKSKKIIKPTLMKIGKLILRILGFLSSLSSAILVPCCICVFPIVPLLFQRFLKYAYELGEFVIAKEQTKDTIEYLQKLSSKSNDPHVKAKCTKMILSLKKDLKELDTDHTKESVLEAYKDGVLTESEVLELLNEGFEGLSNPERNLERIEKVRIRDGENKVVPKQPDHLIRKLNEYFDKIDSEDK